MLVVGAADRRVHPPRRHHRSARRTVRHPLLRRGGAVAARHFVERSVTAIICASDLMALGAIRSLGHAGYDVPGDVSVIGFDDSPTMSFVAPALTTIRQPVAEIAQGAVTALLALAAGSPSASELRYEGELVVRASTAVARVREG
nr:substrate-binding domain-containing protein [Microbacterium sp. Y-01]